MPNNVFDGSEGDVITSTQANTYRSTYEASPNFTYNQGIKGHFFGKDILNDLLNQNGVMGLRIYYGLKPVSGAPSKPQLVVYGTDANGDDILVNNLIADVSKPCPPLCSNGQGQDQD